MSAVCIWREVFGAVLDHYGTVYSSAVGQRIGLGGIRGLFSMIKPMILALCSAKTQISLGIYHPHEESEDPDQAGKMSGLI